MIYIYTISSDQSCNYIIDWLIKLKVHYKRVNSDFFYSFFNFNDDELENNDVHWFWKWEFPDFYSKEYYSSIYNNDIFNFALDTEYRSLFRLYFDNCKGKVINHPHYVNIDKLTQIKIAKRCGMSVPHTIITSSKEQLKLFITKHDKVITKNLVSSPFFIFENNYYQTYTSLVSMEILEKTPEIFFPSLFQSAVEKEFEIRVIVVGDKIFSCAILNNEKILDIREVVNKHVADIIPYKLPIEMEHKIIQFMKIANLQIGSFDFIYNKNREYVFLEVNPSGQFLGYSDKCNYQIEKVIAEYLINKITNE